jgi:hypothetical protein
LGPWRWFTVGHINGRKQFLGDSLINGLCGCRSVCFLGTGPVAELTVCLATIPAAGLLGGCLVVGLLGDSLIAGLFASFWPYWWRWQPCRWHARPVKVHRALNFSSTSTVRGWRRQCFWGNTSWTRRKQLGERQIVLDVVWPFARALVTSVEVLLRRTLP